ncbi:MAG: DUF2382 domain-containing protein [Hyphomicrobiales bacterium]|nr:MAG: DUF2382 domain-containing protein [Hyphomicrobiales bacterium]
MSSTITAMFDSRADAEAAKERLKASNVDADHIQVHDKSSAGYKEQGYSTHEEHGFWASVKNAFLPDEDRHTYEEGVRRGGAVLTADVDEDDVARAVQVLEEAGSVDVDDRASQWRQSGWDYPAGAGAATGASALGGFGDRDTTNRGVMADRDRASGSQEEVIPIVEEKLVVGKRDVDRGGVRVRSYVTETPVHEQVRLRNERVNVERRAVDQSLSAADSDAFRERTIDMTATGEEAVVGKTARVVEEVVVSKTADERVEQIDDTVRRTDVEVDRDKGISTDRSSTFGTSTDR